MPTFTDLTPQMGISPYVAASLWHTAPNPDLTPTTTDPAEWNPRPDLTPKGTGYLGIFGLPNGMVTGEYSTQSPKVTDAKGNQLDYPTFVPTLTRPELQSLLQAVTTNGRVPAAVAKKAEAFALQRQQAGLPLFAQPGESRTDLFPDIQRVELLGEP